MSPVKRASGVPGLRSAIEHGAPAAAASEPQATPPPAADPRPASMLQPVDFSDDEEETIPPVPEASPAVRARWRQLLRSGALKAVADRKRADASALEWDSLVALAAREGIPAGMVVAAAMDADPDGVILGNIPA